MVKNKDARIDHDAEPSALNTMRDYYCSEDLDASYVQIVALPLVINKSTIKMPPGQYSGLLVCDPNISTLTLLIFRFRILIQLRLVAISCEVGACFSGLNAILHCCHALYHVAHAP